MSHKGEWIANCLPERVPRITSASIFLLRVGPPRPNQMQNQRDLEKKGLVGLYRVGKKSEEETKVSQEAYLQQTDFMPSPEVLRVFLGVNSTGEDESNRSPPLN